MDFILRLHGNAKVISDYAKRSRYNWDYVSKGYYAYTYSDLSKGSNSNGYIQNVGNDI